MKDLQDAFEKLQEKKRELRELRQTYKDTLMATPGYKKVDDDLRTIREQKKGIETSVKQTFGAELESLKTDIDTDTQLLSDLALTKMMKGETIEIRDKNDVNYEPVFKVGFKKMN